MVAQFIYVAQELDAVFEGVFFGFGGIRATMTTDLAWACTGLFAALRRDEGRELHVVIRLPFVSLGAAPRSGDEWRANFFRIDRSATHGDDFSAWQPTLKTPADFHVASAFGALRFA